MLRIVASHNDSGAEPCVLCHRTLTDMMKLTLLGDVNVLLLGCHVLGMLTRAVAES